MRYFDDKELLNHLAALNEEDEKLLERYGPGHKKHRAACQRIEERKREAAAITLHGKRDPMTLDGMINFAIEENRA